MGVEHIAVIVIYFPTTSETFIVNQINGLIESGKQISLYAYNKVDNDVIHDSLLTHDLLNKVRYFVHPSKSKILRFTGFLGWTFSNIRRIKWKLFFRSLNVFKYGKDAYTLKLFYEAQWFLVNHNIDLIHAHFGMCGNRIAYLKSMNILPESVKLITTFHGFDIEPGQAEYYKDKYKYLIHETAAYIANTPYLKSLIEEINERKKPVHVLPVGLDTDFFKKTEPKKENPYFDLLFCGKLIPLKGPDLAIKIVEALHKRGYKQVRLQMVGKGRMMDQLQEQARQIEIPDAIIFHGALDQTALKFLFESADVFLMPGRHDPKTGRAETQGLVIQEAQAMEVPVVVSDVGGMKYGMIPDETGILVPSEQIETFVETLIVLINDPQLRANMGENGRTLVESNYRNKILNEKLVRIYDEC
ncbi:MAG: glycosyltransferase family 4 protein [Bacteroidia bacterium]|nr:glycosyltransferase family 4 protein [Bacteroidia bacterium]NNK87399.1 glycosyltransferase family 4 protein [Flavobacteriaceae bacterium]